MKNQLNFLFVFLFVSFCVSTLDAADIHFKTPVIAEGTAIRLGDVAEVTGENAESLKKIPLFFAPIAGGQRIVSTTKIRDMLTDRGIGSLDHRFSGVSQITVNGPMRPQSRPGEQRILQKAEENLRQSLLTYLNRCTTDGKPENAIPWNLKFDLTPEQSATLASGGKIMAIYGGKNPLIGKQEFQAELENTHSESGRRIQVRFFTEISLPPKVVVAKRSIAKGKLISANDVKIVYQENVRETDFISEPQEIVGKMASSLIREGAVLTPALISRPILVRKGDTVTVVAKAPGIAVRSTAKAHEDGSEGDLISLEQQLKPKVVKGTRAPLTSKSDSVFFARVVGIGTVETYADSSKY